MALHNVDRLRHENWRDQPYVLSRLGALQSVEDQMASQENRPALSIGVIPPDKRKLGFDGQPRLKGYFDSNQGENGSIFIDPQLLTNDEPYEAVNTYFHEAQHAYQHDVTHHPERHQEIDPETAALWKRNQEAYLSEEEKAPGTNKSLYEFGHYYGQPIEVDAREAASHKTEQLYAEQFKDQQGYSDYKTKQSQVEQHNEEAALEIGDNYQELAREKMEAKYLSKHPELVELQGADQFSTSQAQANQPNSQGPPAVDQTAEKNPEVEESVAGTPSTSEGSGEDEDYRYGYGY